ncbi:uncharacterized protein [Euphorbia lathyris]
MLLSLTPLTYKEHIAIWVQRFFTVSSGATLLNATLQTDSSALLIASSIVWQKSADGEKYLKIKGIWKLFFSAITQIHLLILPSLLADKVGSSQSWTTCMNRFRKHRFLDL